MREEYREGGERELEREREREREREWERERMGEMDTLEDWYREG